MASGAVGGRLVKVEGARKLRKTLKDAGDNLEDLKAAHARAASIAMEASAALAPRRTGALANSLRSSGTKTAGIVRAGGKRIPYGNPIHWGWFKRNIKPQPFISHGAQDSEGRWLPVYEAAVETALQKVEGA